MTRSTDRISELQRELDANPSSRQFYQLGELLRRDGRAGEAAAALRGGLEHYPRYVAAWVSLGRAELDRRDPAAAAAALERALELDGENPVAWRLLGEARSAGADRAAALAAFRRAAELVPGDESLQDAVTRLEEGLAAGAPEAAAAAPAVVADTEAPPPYVAPAVVRREAVPAAAIEAPRARPAEGPEEDPFAVTASAVGAAAEPDVFQVAVEPPADESLVFGPLAELPLAGAGPFAEAEVSPWVTQAIAVAPLAAAQRELAPPPASEAEALPEAEELVEPEVSETVEVGAPGVEAEAEAEAVAQADLAGEAGAGAGPEPSVTLGGEPMEAEMLAAPVGTPSDADTQPEVRLPAEIPPVATAPPAVAESGVEAARALIRREDLPGAAALLQRVVASEPANAEARELLELVHEMMEPMPDEVPPVSPRERKIAALQRWLACFTLTRERAIP